MNFTHTHVHTQHSILESTIKIPDLLAHVKALGMDAVAITDTQTTSGMVQFSKACAKAGIKPILGAQLNILSHGSAKERIRDLRNKANTKQTTTVSRISLIAKTQEGYRNLSRLLTSSYTEGFDGVPRIDKEMLSTLKDGLLCIMPMDTGEWMDLIRRNRQENVQESLTFYQSVFGEAFYAEIYRPVEYALLTTYEQHLIDLQQTSNLKLIASNAACYLKPEDHFAWQVANAIRQSSKIENPQEDAHRQGLRDICAAEELIERFKDLPQAIAATQEVKDAVEFDFDFNKPGTKKVYHLPSPPIPENETVESYFEKACQAGLEKRLAEYDITPEQSTRYRDRLKYEIDVITKMNFCGYFLIVMDFIQHAKENGIPVGPGRGSGAGSLASYALDITDLDPIEQELLFERFLNPERISMPDFDIDFCMDRRPEVIQYVVNKYGADKVAQIITFGKLQARMVIRDVGRVFGYTHKEMDQISKLIPEILGIKLQDAIDKEPTLQNLINTNPTIALLFETAGKLEGIIRHTSVHAAGLVIANDALNTYCPLYVGRDGVVTTQLDMIDLEEIGLVKFDFLGLKTLTQLDMAQKDIAKRHDPNFFFSKLTLDDPKVYKLLGKGDSVGVFQLESPGMQELCKKLKPDSFSDITAINALFRPGPLGSGMVDDFIQRKHGIKNITYELPQLEPILKETYGVIVYQEQVQKLAVELAGYSLGAADILRRAMGKKKPQEMAKQRDRFLNGTRKNKIPESTARHIFDLMAMFAEYASTKAMQQLTPKSATKRLISKPTTLLSFTQAC